MRSVFISSGIVIIGTVINVIDCSLVSFCPNGALA